MQTLMVATLFLASSNLVWSQTYDIPISKINVAGVALNASFTQLQCQHPTATLQRFSNDGGTLILTTPMPILLYNATP